MSQRQEELLFQLKVGDKAQQYALAYDKTETANINYELVKVNDKNEKALVVDKENLPDHLKPGIDVIVIDSVASGVGREGRDFYDAILDPIFKELGIKHSLLKTTSALSITNFAKSIDLTKDHTIIILSGDTSVVELINGFPSDTKVDVLKNINLVLIPLGTGNALVSSSNIFSEASAVQNIFSQNKTSLPLYQVEFPKESYAIHLENSPPVHKLFFAIVVSWGGHSQLVYRAESPKMRKLGLERFKIVAYQVFNEDMKYECDIFVAENGKERKISHSSIHNYSSILAVPRLEKLYNISPDSQLKKSELHILDFGEAAKDELMALVVEPYKGRAHVDDARTFYESVQPGKEIILQLNEDNDEKSIVCVDGISIKVKNAKGKRIKLSFVDPRDLSYRLNLIGLQ